MIQEEIKKVIEKVIGKNAPNFSVEVPADKSHGDYSTNVALVLAKKAGRNPLEVASEITSKIGRQPFIEKIEVAGPGFINFYLSKDFFVEQLKGINENFPKTKKPFFGAKKVIVEHTQPNPFKIFHIGHLMNNVIGESVARILAANGASVKTASYHGDVGLHVAKAVWGWAHLETKNNPAQIGVWAKAYALGSKAFDEGGEAKAQIQALNKEIYEKSDEGINELYDKGKRASIEHFEYLYKKLDSHFDYHFYESQAGEIGKKLVSENINKVFEKGENGAVIFRGENFQPKTHTRVFLNSEHLPTYEGKEIGLAFLKKVWKYDASIVVTANEQDSFFDVVEVAMGEVFPKAKGKLKHLSHGMLKLPSGKMSSRTGSIISAEELIDNVKGMVLKKATDRNLDSTTVEQIAIGAIKYSILKQSIGSEIIFDFERSVSFEGDSGPYLQYSYVRAVSVLQKAKGEKIKASFKKVPGEISGLEKMMAHFPEVVQKASQEFDPHVITLYLTELAREFNNYYAHHKIVDTADEFSSYKVALIEAFSAIMKNGLWLLGIQAPSKM